MARIVIEVPDEHKPLIAAIEALAEHVAQVAGRFAASCKAVDYAKVKRAIGEKTAAIERAAHQAMLSSLDIDTARVLINGDRWSRVGRYPATYC